MFRFVATGRVSAVQIGQDAGHVTAQITTATQIVVELGHLGPQRRKRAAVLALQQCGDLSQAQTCAAKRDRSLQASDRSQPETAVAADGARRNH